MRLKLVFSYDGSKFQGSQTQPHENGVEDALGAALAHVGIFSKIISSSRTDKGVHANNQVACVECGEHFKDFARLRSLINRHAHPAVHVKFISRAENCFHPRYDATARAYRYVINHGEFSPFLAPYETFLPRFDLNLANELLALFVGEHDFSAFMKLGSDAKSPVRRITKAFCYARGERSIIVFKANGFLRAQVRLMVASVFKALELAKNDKFKETDVREFKFKSAKAANLSANLTEPNFEKGGLNLCSNLSGKPEEVKFDAANLSKRADKNLSINTAKESCKLDFTADGTAFKFDEDLKTSDDKNLVLNSMSLGRNVNLDGIVNLNANAAGCGDVLAANEKNINRDEFKSNANLPSAKGSNLKASSTDYDALKFGAEHVNLSSNLNKTGSVRHQIAAQKIGNESINSALNLTQTISASRIQNAEPKISGGSANENLASSASDRLGANFLKAKELLRRAVYEQKPLTRIPAPPNGLYLNRVFYE